MKIEIEQATLVLKEFCEFFEDYDNQIAIDYQGNWQFLESGVVNPYFCSENLNELIAKIKEEIRIHKGE